MTPKQIRILRKEADNLDATFSRPRARNWSKLINFLRVIADEAERNNGQPPVKLETFGKKV